MGLRDGKHPADGRGKKRGRQGKGGRRSRQQGKDSTEVDKPAGETVHFTPKQGAAGFGIFLFGSFAHMEHKAKGNCQNQVKTPGNRTPVE